MESTLLLLGVGLAGCAVSFLFAGMESGVLSLSRVRIRQQMRRKKRSAKVLHEFLEHPEDFLWTILVGNALASVTVVALLVTALYYYLWRDGYYAGLILAWALAVFLFYSVCDLLPKLLFRLFPNRLCLALALPFQVAHLLLSPLVAALSWGSNVLLRLTGGRIFTGHLFASRDEMRMAMRESVHALSSEEQTMINRVLDLPHRLLSEVVIPLAQALTVSEATPVSAVLDLSRERGITRLPVWREAAGGREIVGVAHVTLLLYDGTVDPAKKIGEYLQPALYLTEDLRLEEALRQIQKSGKHLAIVRSRDRRETGIATLEDILRVIFGEVQL